MRRLCVWVLLVIAAPSVASAQGTTTAQWWERITIGGDLRGRYDGIYQDSANARHRERVRLRLSLTSKIHEELTLGLRFASGEPTDLTSTNQTLADLFRRKTIGIDQAFLAYSPASVRGLTLGGGKFGYPIRRTQLIWDDDLNWEGLYQQYARTWGERTTLRLTAVQAPIVESSGGEDTLLLASAGELSQRVDRHTFTASVANYHFTNVDPIAVAVSTRGLSNPLRNRVTTNDAGAVTGFVADFHLIDVILSATFATPRADYPITLVADWVTNTGAETDRTGIWISAGYGRASRPGAWSATYTFARIEQDAVLSTFNFSDISPTNVRMHQLSASYMVAPRVHLDATGLFTRPLMSGPGVPDVLVTRILCDVRVSF